MIAAPRAGMRSRCEASVPQRCLNDERDSGGPHLVRAETPIHVVQSLMRHSFFATTQLYLGVNEDERLPGAIEELGRWRVSVRR